MKVYIAGTCYDAEHQPIVLVFDTDTERKSVCNHLYNMPERDAPRAYAQYGGPTTHDQRERLLDDALEAAARIQPPAPDHFVPRNITHLAPGERYDPARDRNSNRVDWSENLRNPKNPPIRR